MLLGNGGRAFVLGMILMFFGATTDAQQTVYKWVDEDGVVHFGDAPPDESVSAETKTLITTPPRPTYPPLSPWSARLQFLMWMPKNNQRSRRSSRRR